MKILQSTFVIWFLKLAHKSRNSHASTQAYHAHVQQASQLLVTHPVVYRCQSCLSSLVFVWVKKGAWFRALTSKILSVLYKICFCIKHSSGWKSEFSECTAYLAQSRKKRMNTYWLRPRETVCFVDQTKHTAFPRSQSISISYVARETVEFLHYHVIRS